MNTRDPSPHRLELPERISLIQAQRRTDSENYARVCGQRDALERALRAKTRETRTAWVAFAIVSALCGALLLLL